ncbi:hypothetical protein [Anaerosolibacter sp.]|uniref:hypothetical protein n=1 Tax=Anaerosolibacter sp. TaxID=1872527 RepID=UPI0039F12D8D
MATEIRKRIAEYMSAMSKTRNYTALDVSLIDYAVTRELEERKIHKLDINSRTVEGKEEINQRIADIANKRTNPKVKYQAKDVWIYKQSRANEYQDRTGRCAWGFKEVRAKFGYDPETGLEMSQS